MQSLQMELLQILKEDCRVPLEQLATMTGAPLEEVAQTIDQIGKKRRDPALRAHYQLGPHRS